MANGERESSTQIVRCPNCGREIDKLRAGAVAVFETGMVYYCSTACKAEHRGSSLPPAPAASQAPSETAAPAPDAGERASRVSSPQAPPRQEPAPEREQPAPVPTPAPRPAEPRRESGAGSVPAPTPVPRTTAPRVTPLPGAAADRAVEAPAQPTRAEPEPPEPIEAATRPSGPGARREVRLGPEHDDAPPPALDWRVATRRHLIRTVLGLVLLGVSLALWLAVPGPLGELVPALEQGGLARQIQMAVAGLAVAWLALITGRSFTRSGWRAGLEEALVATGAGLMLIAGVLFPRATGALLATPGIAAFTFAGRWLEAWLRDSLTAPIRPLIDADVDQVEARLWGDSRGAGAAAQGWTDASGSEAGAQASEPPFSEVLPNISAMQGVGASPTGKTATRWAFALGLLAVPLGLAGLLALLYFIEEPKDALILGASLVLALSPRGLRRGWVAPLLTAAGMGARRRLVFRDGAALEATARAHWVVFDALSTLTVGQPAVTRVAKVGALSQDEILAFAAGVEEAAGNDPLGRAVVKAARAKGVVPIQVRLARRSPGLGLSATSPQGDLLVGTRQLILGQGISVAEADEVAAEMESKAETVLFVALAGRIQGVIGLRDELRPGARDVAADLGSLGVEPVLMTGDSRVTAEALGRELGFEHVRAEVPPDQWAAQILSMQETGNGIAVVAQPPRHADTLAVADVGITLGTTGLEVKTAGVAIKGEEPALAVKAVALARGALSAVRGSIMTASILLIAEPGLALLFVGLQLPLPWLVPMVVALVSSLAPALLCSSIFAHPRGAHAR